ncbi:Predicted dithiol-disulfide isomerase, DsbA family [Sulfitobacter marinus]|uniref:Predicted dithiol-disulfide isomerase, DsbA family n=1 Tax=Sulfitobacter marinus TaxID=394264 RepID=A0A1I6RWG7_9RHOB|nr:DsbA family oxidoreductase [Sulfitobacter marinus]SFS69057.1 Predicted dithiol-disulfide isomerase, DsbA family [Sulfitobacter marinus]
MTNDAPPQTAPALQIDIISDVMCPWCIVGYRQLEQALAQTGVGAFIRWHPFELNPQMPPEGQNTAEHIMEKYGASAEQSAQNRAQLVQIGEGLGIDFNFTPDSRIVNSFAAHQLLHWAQEYNLQHPLKLALFNAHFTQGRDVSDHSVLADVAEEVGLDRAQAVEVLEGGSHADAVRELEGSWTGQGISGVPAMVFEGKYLVTGAQGAENYGQVIQKIMAEKTAA